MPSIAGKRSRTDYGMYLLPPILNLGFLRFLHYFNSFLEFRLFSEFDNFVDHIRKETYGKVEKE